MTVSRIQKPASAKSSNTLREAALVQQMEATKAELAKAQSDLAAANAETAAVRAKLETAKRAAKAISRIASR